MAIRQINAPSWKTYTWLAVCDYCGNQSKKLGLDPGEASENARKEGFDTVSIQVERPMKWICYSCNRKGTAGKVV